MGNFNSGRWNAHNPAMTVEQCAVVTASMIPSGAGSGDMALIRYGELKQQVSVTSTPRHFGGVQLYFLCPECDRRVYKLYRRPDRATFVCRHCSKLTYTSSQTSDKTPLMFRLLALRYAAEEATSVKERQKLERKLDRLIDGIEDFSEVIQG